MFKLYNDLVIEIESYEWEIENATTTRDKLIQQLEIRKPSDMKAQQYSDMPKGCRDDTSMDRTLSRIDALTKRIDSYKEVLNSRARDKEKIEDDLTKCEGLQYKIFYLNRIKGYSLWRVSEEIGYSYNYITNINSEINKMIENSKNIVSKD